MRSDIYVAPWGDDANDATEENPLRTLGAAIEAARAYGMAGGTIWLRGGRYDLYGTVKIDGDFPQGVSIRAYPDEEPVIVGSDRISGWRETVLCGVDVWEADVAYSELNALYSDSGALQNARYPKEGMLYVAAASELDGGFSSADALTNYSAFYLDAASLPFNPTGCRVRMLHWWKDECTTVAAYDASLGRVQLTRRTSATVAPGDLVYFENVLAVPLQEGEWAFDAPAGKLYYRPRAGETIENTSLYAGVMTRLMEVSNVNGLSFEGITFAQTGWNYTRANSAPDFPQAAYEAESMLVFSACEGISFFNCTFRDTGGGCIRFGNLF